MQKLVLSFLLPFLGLLTCNCKQLNDTSALWLFYSFFYISAHTHTYTHTHTYIHTHAHIHTHTITYTQLRYISLYFFIIPYSISLCSLLRCISFSHFSTLLILHLVYYLFSYAHVYPLTMLIKQGFTALHIAALVGSDTIVRLLVTYGADVFLRNVNGETARDISARRGNVDCCKLLGQAEGGIHADSDIEALELVRAVFYLFSPFSLLSFSLSILSLCPQYVCMCVETCTLRTSI